MAHVSHERSEKRLSPLFSTRIPNTKTTSEHASVGGAVGRRPGWRGLPAGFKTGPRAPPAPRPQRVTTKALFMWRASGARCGGHLRGGLSFAYLDRLGGYVFPGLGLLCSSHTHLPSPRPTRPLLVRSHWGEVGVAVQAKPQKNSSFGPWGGLCQQFWPLGTAASHRAIGTRWPRRRRTRTRAMYEFAGPRLAQILAPTAPGQRGLAVRSRPDHLR